MYSVANTTVEQLHQLLQEAREAGAADAALLPTEDIVVQDILAARCHSPKCINYGLSKSCPPYVPGPEAMRDKLARFSQAVFLKIEVPSATLYSSQGLELFQLLHEIAAGLEQSAVKKGFTSAEGYAGNSCKKLFCQDYLQCRVLEEDGQCRNPGRARPSMSGFGINASELYKAAGWPYKGQVYDNGHETVNISSICGLVLIC